MADGERDPRLGNGVSELSLLLAPGPEQLFSADTDVSSSDIMGHLSALLLPQFLAFHHPLHFLLLSSFQDKPR